MIKDLQKNLKSAQELGGVSPSAVLNRSAIILNLPQLKVMSYCEY
jgi:hypothetical protein